MTVLFNKTMLMICVKDSRLKILLLEGTHFSTLRKHAHAAYIDFFSAVKIENFSRKKKDILNIFAQNIHCGYML